MHFKTEITESKTKLIAWVFILVYIIYFFIASFLKFNSFSYYDFDLAIHSQILWNILGGSIYNSILGVDFLGNHAHFISFLIAPLYKMLPHPLTLLFLQAAALGLAAYPLYLLAKLQLGPKWALLVSTVYLLYPALGYTNLFEFHPTVFATLFIFFMLYYFYKNRFGFFLLFMILAMLCQENIPLAIITMGFYALFKRRKAKWVLPPILIGGAYFILCLRWIMPYFNKNTIQFIAIYSHLGNSYAEILANIIKHPLEIMKIMFLKQKLFYLNDLFGPLCLFPLLSPLSLLPVIPLLAQHLLSLRDTETTIYYHYAAEMIPFIFLALIFGIKNILSFGWLRKRQYILAMLLLCVSLIYNFHLGPHFKLFKQFNTVFKADELDREKQAILAKIPSQAAVVATFEFLPRLSHRRQLYSFHHVYMGFHTLSNQPYNLPETVNYALLDFGDKLILDSFYTPDRYQNVEKFISQGKWGVSEVRDNIVLFRKNTENKYYLYSALLHSPEPKTSIHTLIDGDIELLGFDLGGINNNILEMTFYWQSMRKTKNDINVFFDFIDKQGRLVYRILRPICYRIFPTNAWEPGQLVKEKKYLVLPARMKGRGYLLKMGFYNFVTGQLCANNSNDALKRVDMAEISF